MNSRNLFPASQEQRLLYTTVVHSAQFPVPLQSLPVSDEQGAQSEEDKVENIIILPSNQITLLK